jgi:hypothetical protein
MNRSFKYRASEDRIYDATMDTPRQIRLRRQREKTLAQFHELVASIVGGLLLVAFILVLFFA